MTKSLNRYEIRCQCLAQMMRRLGETKTQLNPFPHFWTDKILPDAIYDRLLDEMPDDSSYRRGGEGSKHYGNRGMLHLLSEQMDRLPAASQELWYGVRSALAAPELHRAIFSVLAPGLAFRFQISESEAAELPAYPRPLLYRETEGYKIAPHPDTRRKLATVQIALTDDPMQVDLGTSLYRLSLNPKHLVRQPRGFCEVKRHPFLRNSMFAFCVVNTVQMRSWHGREPLPAGCGVRNTLLQVYYSDPADANPEVVEEISSAQRSVA